MNKAELIRLIEDERYEFMFGDGEIESAHNYAMNKAVEIINEALQGYSIVPDEQLKQREWISVDDRLPVDATSEKLFLVIDKNDTRGADVVNYHKIRGVFVDTYYHDDYPIDEITHWQAVTPPTADKE